MSQKKYNQEFKQTVVELYRSGSAVSQLSSEYGVSEVTIYKKASGGAWKRGLEQDFKTETITQKWVADISYIHTVRDGWCYLASVLNLHTKKIVGYKFGRRMTVDLVLDALDYAVVDQKPMPGLILHTDLGSQYTSEDFQKRLNQYEMVPSFSRKGCPYDNACIESFHATLKKEEVYRTRYDGFETARIALFKYIEGWYNRKRIHGSIGYLTPDAFEKMCRAAAWK